MLTKSVDYDRVASIDWGDVSLNDGTIYVASRPESTA